ncbi:hypothetical protein LMH66_00665 [Shewanella sp. 10N.7]|uniref:Uncharacterized protein n=1 Tax=Shewanella electrodiphila TaxID=934143 RepID=A0ABT0KJU7_9GAMM|nr:MULTISPECIES: hypothetical protein [Shewanella]MCC4831143.1 hypothetical protein [Shewanella sp. 10N.7]MCL1044097.1 hypothetical protein [Shewanella electrodiphila]
MINHFLTSINLFKIEFKAALLDIKSQFLLSNDTKGVANKEDGKAANSILRMLQGRDS